MNIKKQLYSVHDSDGSVWFVIAKNADKAIKKIVQQLPSLEEGDLEAELCPEGMATVSSRLYVDAWD